MDFSIFIFLSVLMVAIGYIASNSRDFNFWKIALLGLILIPVFEQFGFSKPHLITIVIAFIVGYLLPHARALEGISQAISDAINAVRYKDIYDDLKKKEAEVEELRRQYEQAKREANREKQEQERNRRQRESSNYQKSQQKKKQQSSGQQRSSKQKQDKSYTGQQSASGGSEKQRYLKILGLDPNGKYSSQEIKKAWRKQTSKYHPDRHFRKGEKAWEEMNERLKEINHAYAWLGAYAT